MHVTIIDKTTREEINTEIIYQTTAKYDINTEHGTTNSSLMRKYYWNITFCFSTIKFHIHLVRGKFKIRT